MKKFIVLALLVLALGVSGAYWYWQQQGNSGTTFRFEDVIRGKLVATVGATGTLQPREVVDVGAQVLGQIIYIGKDPYTQSGIVDWGSEVQGPVLDKDRKVLKPGTVLAQIDPSLYEAQRNSARATLSAAQAALKAAQADVLVKTATLSQATADWGRAQKLFPTGGIAQAEYDQFKSVFQSATANLEVSKSNVSTATAQISVAEANLKTAQTNLDYTTISAPVTGVVIDRRVNLGQTVVASLSAPSLFLIAKDLTKMEVWATVNEVDIGRIHVGKPVDFTVDSNPGRVYHGKVVPQGKLPLRLNATMTSNVVTYTVVVSADNSDLGLRPYQTANLSFIVENKDDALVVPNSALRWQPTREQIAPDVRDAYFKLKNKKRGPTDPDAQDHGIIWTQGDDGLVRFIEVHTGVSDGVKTEILNTGDAAVPEHTRVVVGEEKKHASGGGNNPFSVQMFKKDKSKE
jgi:HlyD family secretion protein